MDEYINRSALLALYQMDGPWNAAGHVPLPVVRQNIMDMPVAEVTAVRYGHWEEASDGDGVVCSECGSDFCVITNETERFRCCPNCGALMKEDEHETG